MSVDGTLTEFPLLETERLLLRALTPEDASDLYTYYSDPQVTKYLDWFGPSSVEQAAEMISSWNNHFKEKRIIPWAITIKENGSLAGTIVYMPIRGTFEANPLLPTTFGFELARAYWHQGIMSEALKAVITFGFHQLSAHRIQAEVLPENTASLQLLKKHGFVEEGLLKKYLYHEGTGTFHDVILLALVMDKNVMQITEN